MATQYKNDQNHPLAVVAGHYKKRKNKKPWPWDPKLSGCQMHVGNLNVARAEAKGQLVRFIPDAVKQNMTFKSRNVHNPKEIICGRCKDAVWEIIQGRIWKVCMMII